jgi:hypothetical protein
MSNDLNQIGLLLFITSLRTLSQLICTLTRAIYFQGTILQGSTNPPFTTGWRSDEKISLFTTCFFYLGMQGCQMVYFHAQNPTLGIFWRVLEWKMLVYFMTIWNILRSFGKFYGRLALFVFIWYIFSRFGMFGPRKIWQPCTYEV